MTTLKRNIAANFAGRVWGMLVGFAFVPLYLKLLGVETYGLIGFFTALQSVLGIMDLGLSLTLNRELARTSGHADDGVRRAALLRTMEVTYWTVSSALGLLVILIAPWIARSWVNAVSLSPAAVENAIRLMGAITALQAPFALYQGGLLGLQRQVTVNLILAVSATLRAVGAVLVLWFLSRTVEAFFLWQAVVAAGATITCAWALWREIPGEFFRARVEFARLAGVWRFAIAVSLNAIVGIMLTQADKLILSKLLSLERFGLYSLAGVAAASIWSIIFPINTAIFPRMVQLYEQRDEALLAAFYHKACQLMALALLPVAMLLILFNHELLLLWTHNEDIARSVGPLVALLTLGTTLNGLASVPGSLQSAAGWPALVLRTNSVLAVVLVPAMFLVVPRFGPLGAAFVWVVINSAYLVVTIPVMHRRLLRGQARRWYWSDTLLPLLAVCVVGVVMRLLMPEGWPLLAQLAFVAVTWVIGGVAVLAVAPDLRRVVKGTIQRRSRNAADGGIDILS